MMRVVQYIRISEAQAQQRLDNFLLKTLKGVPKSHVYRMIRHGEVRINKGRAKPDTRLQVDDEVRIPPVRVSETKSVNPGTALQTLLEASILFEDDGLIVINKPAGIAVHGGSGVNLGVIEAFRSMRPELHFLELAHRLDKDTSGCLVLAKKRAVLLDIQSQLVVRTVQKTYWALLHNSWKGAKNRQVDALLLKHSLRSGERFVSVHPEGKPALTYFTLLENFSHYCLVSVKPKTGRTHQIRVHAAWLSHPIVGDVKYTKSEALLQSPWHKKRLYLHAQAIQFILNEKKYRFEAPLDIKFSETLKQLRLEVFE